MMHFRSILYVAVKLFKSRRQSGGFAPSAVSVAGLATGVAALIVVLAVMNGFQMGFIEDILEISSFHVRVHGPYVGDAGFRSRVEALDQVRSVTEFAEDQTLIRGAFSQFEACMVKAFTTAISREDPALVDQLGMVYGTFDLSREDGVILGEELARRLAAPVGTAVSVLSLADGTAFGGPETVPLVVVGVFRSGYYEFDKTLAIVGFDAMERIVGATEPVLGVKLNDRNKDASARRAIEGLFDGPTLSVTSWRDYNRAFFSALRVEKIAMTMLLALIFVVVGFSIYQSMRRTIFEQREEIAVLKSLGARSLHVQAIFVADGAIVGMAGAVVGVVIGLLLSVNVNVLFSVVEWAVNTVLRLSQAFFLWTDAADLAFFSPMYFYMQEVPVRLVSQEIVYICSFAIVSAIVSAYAASLRVSGIYPSQVLRYE